MQERAHVQPKEANNFLRWPLGIGQRLIDLLFPPACLACGSLGGWLCAQCTANLEPLEPGWCGYCNRIALGDTTLCRRCRERTGLVGITSCFWYRGTGEVLLGTIKFKPAAIGIDALATTPLVATQQPTAGLLIPIPAQRDNEQRRGFNQAERLVRALAHNQSTVRVSDCLVRTRNAAAQVGLAATDRAVNAEGLYRWTGTSLQGKQCVLVDDVTTTGATLADAARALKAAGARGVTAFTLAQTPPHSR